MYIERVTLAQLLGTKHSNLRTIRQSREEINVQLWNSQEPVVVDIQQYKIYVEALRKKDKTHVEALQKHHHEVYIEASPKQSKVGSGGSKKGVSVLLMIVGAIIILNGYTTNTTVSTSYGSVHNVGLINEQNKQLQLGGMAFIAGIILYCLDRKESD